MILESSSRSDKKGGDSLKESSLGSIGGGGGVKSDLSEFTAEIIGIDLAQENGTGKQFVNYVVRETSLSGRYCEDALTFSTFTKPSLASTSVCPSFHSVPGKKTFWNLERNIVEKRKKMLSEYLGQRGPPQHRH